MAFLSDSHSSIWGKTEKAVLIINYKLPEEESNLKLLKSPIKLPGQQTDNTPPNLKLLKSPIKLPMQTYTLHMQYNPSTISIEANSQDVNQSFLQKDIDAGAINQNIRKPSIVLSVDLIFDDVNNKDAFMFEKFPTTTTPTVGGVISSAGGIYRNLAKGGYTVMPQTNGLVAMVLRSGTRSNVTFKWADMSFNGEITEMNARYTMFSVSGKPIRSVVTVRISQSVGAGNNHNYWNNAFNKCFGKAEVAKVTGGKNIVESSSNLMNIQF